MSLVAKGRECTTSKCWGGLSLLASPFRHTSTQAEDALSVATSIAGLLTSVVAVVALVFAWRQTLQARNIHVAETRPYVVPSLVDGLNRDGKASLYLRLENHGRTPAIDIVVDFESELGWHHVAHPSFPFTSSPGIPLLAPGSALEFFLGVKAPEAEFVENLESGLRVTVSFATQIHAKRHRDMFSVTARNKYARVDRVETSIVKQRKGD